MYRHIFFFFQEEEYEQALKKFSNALQITGFKPHLSYNIALSYFKLKEYAASLKHIGKVSILNYQIIINNVYINKMSVIEFNLYFFL